VTASFVAEGLLLIYRFWGKYREKGIADTAQDEPESSSIRVLGLPPIFVFSRRFYFQFCE
jgi:hypothetical protein